MEFGPPARDAFQASGPLPSSRHDQRVIVRVRAFSRDCDSYVNVYQGRDSL